MSYPDQPEDPTPTTERSGGGLLGQWLGNRLGGGLRAERDEALRANQVASTQLRLVFEQATDGLLICGSGGKVLACNPVAARMLGDLRSQIVGRPLSTRLRQGAAHGAAGLCNGEAHLLREHGEPLPVELRIHEMPALVGKQWLVQMHDLSDRRQVQERLVQLANFDNLTGLPNRALFRDRLTQAMKRAQRSGVPMALMFLDLDRFKVVNDSLGHEVGDRLLQHVARSIVQCLRIVDTVGRVADDEGYLVSRLGGDEFTVIAEGIGGAEDAAMVARRVLESLNAPFVVGDEEIVVTASIGITTYPTDDVDLDTLLRHTDMAMYRAKASGRGTYCFFSDDLNASVSARLSMEGSLRRAIEREEFTLHYQPKAHLRSGEITGVEALIRWHCPGRGLVPPDRFITVLEDTGLILPVGAWVIRTACAQLAAWDKLDLPRLRLAINVSARQFRHPFLVALVEDTLRDHGIEPGRVEIELTESMLMEDTDATRAMLANFARIGLRLALDDFGTGHSSLAYLKRFRIDTLKVDRSFVTSLPDTNEDRAIAGAVVALGHSMGMTVVAEGVETQAQADVLVELGCDEMQGYLLSRPLPPTELTDWLLARQLSAAQARQEQTRAREKVEPISLTFDSAFAPGVDMGDDVDVDAEAAAWPGISLWATGRRGGHAPAAHRDESEVRSGPAAQDTEPDTQFAAMGEDAGVPRRRRRPEARVDSTRRAPALQQLLQTAKTVPRRRRQR